MLQHHVLQILFMQCLFPSLIFVLLADCYGTLNKVAYADVIPFQSGHEFSDAFSYAESNTHSSILVLP
jgi:hypothetical protein